MKMLKTILSIVVASLLIPIMVAAQSATYTLDESSSITVSGTSTLHDWEANAKEIDLSVSMNPAATSATGTSPVSTLQLTIPVSSMESGKGKMDRKMKEALKEDEHPTISFKMTSSEISDANSSMGESFALTVTGNLSIAGVQKEVSFPVTGVKETESSYRFEGNYSLNMEDYNMERPSVMFGTIKAGEEVTISFNILLTNNQNQ